MTLHEIQQALKSGKAGIEIAAANLLESDPKKIVILGTTSFPGGLGLTGTTELLAIFELVESRAEDTLGATFRYKLPQEWKFLSSFPELPIYDYASGESALDTTFSLTERYFYLTTHAHQQLLPTATAAAQQLALKGDEEVRLEVGLSFVGRLADVGTLGLLARLASGVVGKPVLLHGLVIPSSTSTLPALNDQPPWDAQDRARRVAGPPIPGIHLEIPLGSFSFLAGSGTPIKFSSLRLVTYSPLSEYWLVEDASYEPAMAYLGDVEIGSAKLLTVSAIVSSARDDELVFTCRFDENVNLDNLLNAFKTGKDSILPKPLRNAIGTLGPQSASITLVRSDKGYEVACTQFTIGTGEGATAWSPFDKPFDSLIKLKFDSIKVVVFNPFHSDHRSVFGTFKGQVTICGVELVVKVEAPSLSISAEQNGTAEFGFREWCTKLGMPSSLPYPPDFEIANITLVAEPGLYYAFSMDIAPGQEWMIQGKSPSQKYSLPRVRFGVSCTTEKGGPYWGWQFEASTDGAKGVPVFLLIQKLAAEVGIGELKLSTAIEGLTVDRVTLSYDSKSKDFAFECWGTLPVNGDGILECSFTIKKQEIKKQEKVSRPEFGGTILLSQEGKQPLSFGLQFGADSNNDPVLAFSGGIPSGLSLTEVVGGIAEKLGVTLTLSNFPDALNPALTSLNGYLNIKTKDLVLSAETLSGTTVAIAVAGSGENKKYAFLIDKKLHLGLSSLPLVGDKIAEASGKIAGIEDVGIENLQAIITYGLADYKTNPQGYQKDVGGLNGLIELAEVRFNGGGPPTLLRAEQHKIVLPRLLTTPQNKIHLRVTYFFAEKPQEPIAFPFEAAPPSVKAAPESGFVPVAEPITAQSAATWLDVQRSFGPISVKRLGIACAQGQVRFLLDASLVVSGLTMDLQGLSLAFPISAITKFQRNEFLTKLDGLSVTYESGPIAVGGGLLKVDPAPAGTDHFYSGQLLMRAKTWALTVDGSFAQLKTGESSVSAYGFLNATLGGPSFFFITGLAAGFGYNRSLTLPTLNDLPSFPLIAASRTGNLGTLREEMFKCVYPAPGQNWLAAGVRFTSFKVIDSFALLTFSFGNRFEVALLGLSTITMPARAPNPIASAQLALEAKFAPEDGVLKIAAQLTAESYILDKKCRLTGGFALYTWFKDENEIKAGDFVLSIGGYHPKFKPPAGYPSVPRVQANWRVNDNLTIKGGFYFALTPNAIMAGGALEANYDCGRFKAWFDARVDFLLSWEPFYYEAHAKLNLGVSYTIDNWLITKTITCQVGVDLTLQGPPFGGKAVVDLYVCSFTLDFGDPAPPPGRLLWQNFKDRFLPPVVRTQDENASAPAGGPTDSYCYSRPAAGLIKELPAGSDVDWIVNPETFVIETASAIPCSEVVLVNQQQKTTLPCDNVEFGVAPCEIQNHGLKSTHWIEWKKDGNSDGPAVEWKMPEAIKTRLPRAAWSPYNPDSKKKSPEELLAEERVTGELTTGFRLSPKWTSGSLRTSGISVNVKELGPRETVIPGPLKWTSPAIPAPFDPTKTEPLPRLSTVNEDRIKTRRNLIASALKRQHIAVEKATAPRYLQDAAIEIEKERAQQAAAGNKELPECPVLCELGS